MASLASLPNDDVDEVMNSLNFNSQHYPNVDFADDSGILGSEDVNDFANHDAIYEELLEDEAEIVESDEEDYYQMEANGVQGAELKANDSGEGTSENNNHEANCVTYRNQFNREPLAGLVAKNGLEQSDIYL